MNRRLQVLGHWLRGRRHGVGFAELLAFLSRRTIGPRARAVVRKTENREGEIAIWLEGIDRPLYWPREFPISSLHQVISEAFYADDWHFYEAPETRVMPGDTVVDCGAAEGLFTLLAARSAAKVFAIEPQPRFLETLQRTIEGASNVEILPFALGAQRGMGRIAFNGIAASVTDDTVGAEVEVTTIDVLLHDRCDRVSYIKADLEGYDLAMLEGAAEIIRRDSPRIAVTTYHRAEHAPEMKRLLSRINAAYRFRCKGIYQGTGSPMMLHAWVD